MDQFLKYHAGWRKPDTKEYRLCGFIIWNSKEDKSILLGTAETWRELGEDSWKIGVKERSGIREFAKNNNKS